MSAVRKIYPISLICFALLPLGTASSLGAQNEPKTDESQQESEPKKDKEQGKKEETKSRYSQTPPSQSVHVSLRVVSTRALLRSQVSAGRQKRTIYLCSECLGSIDVYLLNDLFRRSIGR